MAFTVDMRRVNEETLMRIGMHSAPINGRTIDDFLEGIKDPRWVFPLRVEVVRYLIRADCRKSAEDAAGEWAATGAFKNGDIELITFGCATFGAPTAKAGTRL